MTWLDLLWILIAGSVGFLLGTWWFATIQAEECSKCKHEYWTFYYELRNNERKDYANFCEGYCFDCKHYDGTIDNGKCKLCDGYVEATDYCLSWEGRKDV